MPFRPTDPEGFFGQLFSSDPNVRQNAIAQQGKSLEGQTLAQDTFDQLFKAAMSQDDEQVLGWTPDIYPHLDAEQAMALARERFDERRLIASMQSPKLPNRDRRAAGLLLGTTGWLPDDLDVFLPVADEPFLYGEQPVETKLGHAFWIAKYPVSNAQFARFIDDGGYARDELWDDAGKDWREGEK